MSELRLPSFNDFSPEILKQDLRPCLKAVVDGGGDDSKVIKAWADTYFKGVENKRSSCNISATLGSTGLSTRKRPITLSEIGKAILDAPTAKEATRLFCSHLLRNKNGKLVIEALAALKKRNIKVTKQSLKKELEALGVTKLSINTTDHSTLKNWLVEAGLVSEDGTPNDDEIKSLLGISSTEIDEFKSLSLGQQVFLELLRKSHETSEGPFLVMDLNRTCLSAHPHLFDEAQLARQVRIPLEKGGWVETTDLGAGPHGGRSGKIRGTKKLLDIPVSEVAPDWDQVIPPELRSKLNTPLPLIAKDLYGKDKHKAGLGLELLALRMIIDLELDPRHFRVRSAQTGFAEVDLIAEGTHLLFSRWTFQCKRYGEDTKAKVGLGDVAKEVGIAVHAKAHVIVMVTTTDFSKDAKDYALEVSRATHLQFVFLDGKVIQKYLQNGREVLWSHFLQNAKHVMTVKRDQTLPTGE